MPVGHREQCVLDGFRSLVGVILATIRADATVASEIDCFCDATVYTLVGEEAATLILAGQHLVDFVEFDRAEVIFFCKAKCSPVAAIVLEYVFDRERGIRSKTEENNDEACSGCEDVQVHQSVRSDRLL
jgi:hypothetical protein